MGIDITLKNLDSLFPAGFSEEERARAKTVFLKKVSLYCHRFYGGKMETVPKGGIYGKMPHKRAARGTA